jgi:hypothetical protein
VACVNLHVAAAKQIPVSIMMMKKIQNPAKDTFRINLQGLMRYPF